LLAKKGPEVNAWLRGTGGDGIPVKAPNAVIVWDFIHRAMPLRNEGTLSPNEVYALTAYLLAINKIIPEDQVLDQNNLAKVKMPIGNEWVRVPDWKPRSPRLAGYPY
jgi:cytochrome c